MHSGPQEMPQLIGRQRTQMPTSTARWRRQLRSTAREVKGSSAESTEKKVSIRDHLKDWSAIVQSALTIFAILLGGGWFLYQQTLKPQLKLEHIITKRKLQGMPSAWIVSVEVIATNTGKVRETLRGGSMNIVQVNPLPGRPVFEPTPLSDLQLDPGETDQALFRTYEISDARATIEVQSQYPVPAESSISSFLPSSWFAKSDQKYWQHDSIFDVSNPN
jgi:hypothetical protein